MKLYHTSLQECDKWTHFLLFNAIQYKDTYLINGQHCPSYVFYDTLYIHTHKKKSHAGYILFMDTRSLYLLFFLNNIIIIIITAYLSFLYVFTFKDHYILCMFAACVWTFLHFNWHTMIVCWKKRRNNNNIKKKIKSQKLPACFKRSVLLIYFLIIIFLSTS